MRKIWMLLLPLLGWLSCGNFLDIEPQDELSRAEALSTIRGIDAILVGAYQQLSFTDYYAQSFLFFPEMVGNLVPLDDNAGSVLRYRQVHDLNVPSDYEGSALNQLYDRPFTLLYAVNDVLAALPDLEEGTPEQRASLRGEALHLRAVAHFDMVRVFAQAPGFSNGAAHPGIPLIDRPLGVLDQPSRATVAEIYDLIVRDLTEAADLVDPSFSRRNGDNVWIEPAVVLGALARVQAYREDWQSCAEFATRAITASGRELTPRETYLEAWEDRDLPETLWRIDIQRLLTSSGGTSPARIAGRGEEDPLCRVSEDLMSLFAPDDLRRQLYPQDTRGFRLTAKYPFSPSAIFNPIYLRLSELYLLRAEANAALNNDALAQADYDLIHQRAVLNAPPITLTGPELLEEIRRERRRELALEGHLLFDLSRWGADIDRDDCAGSVRFCDLTYPSPYFILPIPEDALFRNPNLTQNEGY
ncbi:RagB/SusD family nutrient uptake outer membrane protein [Lewinella sp. W8]|uniref:RagB/SusD family nutrient uptake outer membrane protein n=1 Tax=Lewinella sp. W8 TaxID=2528208 RepID=UPI0015635C70|nr:RagB/SusD family nutrient uptake outer membrane protein [Lewinella sp. W8]